MRAPSLALSLSLVLLVNAAACAGADADARCNSNSDCLNGEECTFGACAPRDRADAGDDDAGTPGDDAGTPGDDAGTPDDDAGVPPPVCPPGYGGDGCASWLGVIPDPTFELGGWTATGTATVRTADPGNTSPGVAEILIDECDNVDAAVFVDVTLPALADQLEPLALSYAVRVNDCGARCEDALPALFARVGAQLEPALLGDGEGFVVRRVCLGAHAAGDARVAIGIHGDYCELGEPAPTILVDDVNIAPDPSCPAVGSIENADFADDLLGWTTNDATIEDAAARLEIHRCGSASIRTEVLMPLVPSVVEYDFDAELFGPDITYASFFLGGPKGFGLQLPNDVGPTRARHCVATGDLGQVTPLSWRGFGGSLCDDLLIGVLHVDNVVVTPEPACVGARVSDPGFEQTIADAPTAWVTGRPPANGPSSAHVSFVEDGVGVGGSGGLVLEVTGPCLSASASTRALVPEGADGPANAGPAFTFSTRSDGLIRTSFQAFASLGAFVGGESVTPGDDFTTHVICLAPLVRGLPVDLTFFLDGGSGACDGIPAFPAERVIVDDVDVIFSDTCLN